MSISIGLLTATVKRGTGDRMAFSNRLDNILTHRIFGYPIFLFFMWLVFQTTFVLGKYPANWIDKGIDGALRLGCSRSSRRICERSADSGSNWWCRLSVGVHAQHHDSLSRNRSAGGFRLHGPGGIYHGSSDAGVGVAWQSVHPNADGLRVQRAGDHGDPNAGITARPYPDNLADSLSCPVRRDCRFMCCLPAPSLRKRRQCDICALSCRRRCCGSAGAIVAQDADFRITTFPLSSNSRPIVARRSRVGLQHMWERGKSICTRWGE